MNSIGTLTLSHYYYYYYYFGRYCYRPGNFFSIGIFFSCVCMLLIFLCHLSYSFFYKKYSIYLYQTFRHNLLASWADQVWIFIWIVRKQHLWTMLNEIWLIWWDIHMRRHFVYIKIAHLIDLNETIIVIKWN